MVINFALHLNLFAFYSSYSLPASLSLPCCLLAVVFPVLLSAFYAFCKVFLLLCSSIDGDFSMLVFFLRSIHRIELGFRRDLEVEIFQKTPDWWFFSLPPKPNPKSLKEYLLESEKQKTRKTTESRICQEKWTGDENLTPSKSSSYWLNATFLSEFFRFPPSAWEPLAADALRMIAIAASQIDESQIKRLYKIKDNVYLNEIHIYCIVLREFFPSAGMCCFRTAHICTHWAW